MSTPRPQEIMKGGLKEYMIDFSKKIQNPVSFLTATVISLAIVFQREIPLDIKIQASTATGKLLLFLVTLYVAMELSWLHGLLLALLTSILIATSPRKLVDAFMNKEGFLGDYADTKFVGDNKRRWFVEQVLNENPEGIQEERVSTQAAQ
jgi:hypothetical protein